MADVEPEPIDDVRASAGEPRHAPPMASVALDSVWAAAASPVHDRANGGHGASGRFAALAEHAFTGMFVVVDDRFVYANSSAAELTGFTTVQLLASPSFLGLIDESERAVVNARIRSQLDSGEPSIFRTRVRQRDGTPLEVEIHASRITIDGRPAIGATLSDVSGSARAALALRQSEERFRAAFDQALTGMTITAPNGQLLRVNASFCAMVGYDAAELTANNLQSLVHPDDLADSIRLADDVMSGRSSGFKKEQRFFHRDGSTVWVALNTALVVDERGDPLHVVAHMYDITERKRAEQALRASEQRYRGLVETTHEGVWSMDAVGRTTYVNPRMASMLGYSPAEMIGRSYFEFMDVDGSIESRTVWARHRRGFSDVYERNIVKKDGTLLSTLISASPLMGEDGEFNGALAMVTDTTQRQQLERQLRQAQKMEAVGQLAGGIAHDFNNLLTAILGNLELARLTLAAGSEAAADIDEAARAARLAAELTKQLLAFSRQQVLQPRTVDINRVLSDALSLLARTLGDDVKIETALWPSPCAVLADPVHLQSVIMNLAVNARDAMPDGGTITFATQLTQRAVPESIGRRVRGTPTDYAMLIVRDTGSGMSDAVRARIFEPFFTTKDVGKGTGLGLASVYGTVQQTGGFIEVTSEVDAGSEFRVYLPCTPNDPAAGVVPAATAQLPRPRLGETMLLVEDEALVRALARRVLERAGYHVLEAHDGEHGLALAREWGETLVAVVTDVMMPGLKGPAMVAALRVDYPHLAVVFMSGFSDEALEERALVGAEVFIQKPWTGNDLVAAVHHARLAQRRSTPV